MRSLMLRRQVSDPALRAKLVPDYRSAVRRVLFNDDYYPALGRDNVNWSPRDRAQGEGVRPATANCTRQTCCCGLTGAKATEFRRRYGCQRKAAAARSPTNGAAVRAPTSA